MRCKIKKEKARKIISNLRHVIVKWNLTETYKNIFINMLHNRLAEVISFWTIWPREQCKVTRFHPRENEKQYTEPRSE